MTVGRISETKGTKAVGDAAFSAPSVKIPELLLSQSGSIATAKDGQRQQPLLPGLAGQFTALTVTSLSPSGIRTTNTFPIDDKGMLHSASSHPLGHVPYEVSLVGKDGAKYSAVVDVTPSKMKVSTQGYFDLHDIELSREKPPAPPLASSIEVPQLLLSQSGSIATAKDGQKQKPLAPNFDGRLKELVVTAYPWGYDNAPSASNHFPIDDQGMLHAASARPLGHVPYRLELVDDEGNRWAARVDISPSKVQLSSQGYFDVDNLKFERVTDADVLASAPAPKPDGEGLRNFAASAQKPIAGERTSPTMAFFRK